MGFAGHSLAGIRLGGELHDIGKIGTSETVLHKPGTLTKEEFDQITKHPLLGEKMLSPLAQDSPDVLRIVRQVQCDEKPFFATRTLVYQNAFGGRKELLRAHRQGPVPAP